MYTMFSLAIMVKKSLKATEIEYDPLKEKSRIKTLIN